EEWDRVIELIKEHNHIPIFDCAYQGFASGDLKRDAYPIRTLDAAGGEMIVCQSFSKNFGLYAERVGAVHVVHNKEKAHTANILSTIKSLIRQTYSVNPVHGAYIVSVIWNDPELRQMWVDNVHTMCNRILEMRNALKAALDANGCPGDWSHIT
ncbi:aspartate/other aminotransferase, partial [Kipferlia bialata]